MINSNWNIQDIISNLEALKSYYNNSLASFSYFDKPSLLLFKKQFKQNIYSLKIRSWQKDKVWQFLNGDEAIIYAKDFLRKN